jgi:hypothetical protein
MKPKLSLVAILSISAIAGGIALGSVSSAEACYRSKSYYKQQRSEQANWLKSPLAAVVTLPGIAIAAALSLGNRYYNKG